MSHVLGPRLDALTAAQEGGAEEREELEDAFDRHACVLPGVPCVPPDAVGPLRLVELRERSETRGEALTPAELAELAGAHGPCDCGATPQDVPLCPHLVGARYGFLASLRLRLEHLALLEDAYPVDVPTIRDRLHHVARIALVDDVCAHPARCHLRRYVDALFGGEKEEQNEGQNEEDPETVPADEETATVTSPAVAARHCGAKACVNVSFGSNVGLCGAKLVAYVLSGSMALLASLVDSCLDILSGLVLVVCARLARGRRRHNARCNRACHRCSRCDRCNCFSRCLRRSSEPAASAYPIGRRRYETLGVLSFSCIMGTFALTLAYESILRVIELSKAAPEKPTRYGALQMGVIGATIGLKLALCIACDVCGRRLGRTDELRDTLLAYRDDHRNDVLSNAVGFVAGFIGARFNGHFAWVDPAGSLLLSCYILVNWTGAALAQIRLLAGKAVPNPEMARVVLHAMHFDPRVEHVNRAAVYRCGRDATVELALCLPDSLPIVDCHRLVHALSDAIESLDGIERCHVHVESEHCVNPPHSLPSSSQLA